MAAGDVMERDFLLGSSGQDLGGVGGHVTLLKKHLQGGVELNRQSTPGVDQVVEGPIVWVLGTLQPRTW